MTRRDAWRYRLLRIGWLREPKSVASWVMLLRSLSLSLSLLLLAGCNSLPGPLHPGTAVLGVERPGRGLRGDVLPYTVVTAVDGREPRDAMVPGGISLRPGWHSVSLSARRNLGQTTGRWTFGRLGEALGRAIDELQSATLERTLDFYAQPGRDYLVRREETPFGSEFRIVDRATREQVSR